MSARIGIDLGGTKIEALVLDENGAECYRQRVATPQGDYDATLNAIVQLVSDAEKATQYPCSVGVAIPGAISLATGRVKNANSVCLNGRDLKYDLEQQLARPVRLSNDANCFTLSEAMDGAAAQADVVFGVILGTGTGGGIVVNKHIITGRNAIAGEWGHNPLPWPLADELPGPACYCGRHGCIETFLSGPGMQADHFRHCGQQRSTESIVESTLADHQSEATLQRYEQRLARALAHVINILDPDVIVLGGGLSNITRLYSNVPQYWSGYIFSDTIHTRLVAPKFGDSSGVRGAAWLWPGESEG